MYLYLYLSIYLSIRLGALARRERWRSSLRHSESRRRKRTAG
jgi:hypothetical protein